MCAFFQLSRFEFLHSKHFIHRVPSPLFRYGGKFIIIPVSSFLFLLVLLLVHQDIKPDNFLVGLGLHQKAALLHLIDFGLAKYYRDPHSPHHHIPMTEHHSLIGTARYCSIPAHVETLSLFSFISPAFYVLFSFVIRFVCCSLVGS